MHILTPRKLSVKPFTVFFTSKYFKLFEERKFIKTVDLSELAKFLHVWIQEFSQIWKILASHHTQLCHKKIHSENRSPPLIYASPLTLSLRSTSMQAQSFNLTNPTLNITSSLASHLITHSVFEDWSDRRIHKPIQNWKRTQDKILDNLKYLRSSTR